MSREIPLTRGYVALVDAADYDVVVAAGPWHVHVGRSGAYAQRHIRNADGTRTMQLLHRFLLSLTGHTPHVDHANRNSLDNRRTNLRICTRSQNKANGRKYRNGETSQFRGVSWCKSAAKWKAEIRLNRVAFYLGCFVSEWEAAQAYNRAARECFGEFANPNGVTG